MSDLKQKIGEAYDLYEEECEQLKAEAIKNGTYRAGVLDGNRQLWEPAEKAFQKRVMQIYDEYEAEEKSL